VCDDNKTEGGCGCQDRRCAGGPEAWWAARAAAALFRAGGAVAAGGHVRCGGGQRYAQRNGWTIETSQVKQGRMTAGGSPRPLVPPAHADRPRHPDRLVS